MAMSNCASFSTWTSSYGRRTLFLQSRFWNRTVPVAPTARAGNRTQGVAQLPTSGTSTISSIPTARPYRSALAYQPQHFPFDVDLVALWERLIPAHLLGEDIQTFPPEVMLLFLCVHGSKDLWWRRIGWICDIAELVGSSPDLDWSYSLELATHAGARRMLLLGVALARELLQTPLPEHVCSWIRSDIAVQPLIEHTYHRLFDEQTIRFPVLERQRFRLRVRERPRDRIPVYKHLLQTIFVMIFVPNVKDRELIRLPGSLSALYYLVRPARLARRYWSHTFRRSNTSP